MFRKGLLLALSGVPRRFVRTTAPKRSWAPMSEPLKKILALPFVVVTRSVEVLNIAMGIEQRHTFDIRCPDGNVCLHYLSHFRSCLSLWATLLKKMVDSRHT
jgi:hypothetical protein